MRFEHNAFSTLYSLYITWDILQMWKSVVGHDVNVKVQSEGDDWETDPNFEVSRPENKCTTLKS